MQGVWRTLLRFSCSLDASLCTHPHTHTCTTPHSEISMSYHAYHAPVALQHRGGRQYGAALTWVDLVDLRNGSAYRIFESSNLISTS